MKRCINCKYYFVRDICGFCNVNGNIIEIKHPFFMGGPKKCSCYEKIMDAKDNKKFTYPKKDENKEEK